MDRLVPTYRVTSDEPRHEVHFAISGFFDLEHMKAFLREVNVKAAPLTNQTHPIHALGDMAGFVPSNKETAELIQDHLRASQKVGLTRVAILRCSPLMTLQYKRLSDCVEVAFFEEDDEALAWLRRPY
ncbi:MAG: hypothetical protein SXU28_12980 [Pseudomonadota bacterium]|nr:hypothetical protein [Pseudomonadota bacterium]